MRCSRRVALVAAAVTLVSALPAAAGAAKPLRTYRHGVARCEGRIDGVFAEPYSRVQDITVHVPDAVALEQQYTVTIDPMQVWLSYQPGGHQAHSYSHADLSIAMLYDFSEMLPGTLQTVGQATIGGIPIDANIEIVDNELHVGTDAVIAPGAFVLPEISFDVIPHAASADGSIVTLDEFEFTADLEGPSTMVETCQYLYEPVAETRITDAFPPVGPGPYFSMSAYKTIVNETNGWKSRKVLVTLHNPTGELTTVHWQSNDFPDGPGRHEGIVKFRGKKTTGVISVRSLGDKVELGDYDMSVFINTATGAEIDRNNAKTLIVVLEDERLIPS